MNTTKPAIWFPTVKTNTGSDVFTERLVEGLNKHGIRAEITWLPLRAEYLACSVSIPKPPEWATVVHINTWLNARFLPKHLPIIATLHHAIHTPELRPHKGWFRAAYHKYWIAPNERKIMQHAKHVTAVSQFVANMAQQTLCEIPIHIIYNSIDTDQYRPETKETNKPFRLLYIGAWRKLKGVNLLAAIMHELGVDFELQYTGGKEAAEDTIHMLKNTHDLGRLTHKQVIKAMQNADAFIFPSRSEGFGLVVAEAMACGLPVVISDCSALTELVDHGMTGFLCKKDNIDDFVEAVRLLASDESLRKKLADAARIHVENNFKPDTMIKNYIQIYTQAITNN